MGKTEDETTKWRKYLTKNKQGRKNYGGSRPVGKTPASEKKRVKKDRGTLELGTVFSDTFFVFCDIPFSMKINLCYYSNFNSEFK